MNEKTIIAQWTNEARTVGLQLTAGGAVYETRRGTSSEVWSPPLLLAANVGAATDSFHDYLASLLAPAS